MSGSTAGHALVTGGASGIGAAFVARLRTEGFEVESLDLVTGFDVTDPEAWEDIGPVDVACLNAGVLGGPSDPAELTLDGYRREYGREDQDFAMVASCSDAFDYDAYRRLEDVGVTHLLTMPWFFYSGFTEDLQERIDGIHRFTDDIVSRFT